MTEILVYVLCKFDRLTDLLIFIKYTQQNV